jgi:hypothetical protein
MKKIIAIVMILGVSATACADAHYRPAEAGPSVPPIVDGMGWATNSQATDCAIGVIGTGAIAVTAAADPPAGVVAWLAYSTGAFGSGYSLNSCWNEAQRNWRSFNVYVHCYGTPTVAATFNDFREATAYVNIPFCTCNQGCIAAMNAATAMVREKTANCHGLLKYANPWCVAFTLNALSTTDDPPPDPLYGLQPGQSAPLPSDFDTPNWDTSIPIPPPDE